MGASDDLLARTVIGREGPQRAIRDLLAMADEARRVLAITGDAGLGKTCLARLAAADARNAGRVVLEGRANTIDARLPLGAYRNAIREARRRDALPDLIGDELAQLFPKWLLPELGEQSPVDLDVVFESAARFLRMLADGSGALVVLEDLHLAAPSTCALTLHLAEVLRDEPVAFLLTYRDGEPTRSLDTLRSGLARARLGDEMPLPPLTVAQVGSMLREILGVEAAPAAVREIAATAAGNPFAVEETLRECVTAGWLDRRTGAWSAPAPVPVPWTVREVITARVHELDPADADVLRWAAVLGERADTDVLQAVGGIPAAVLQVAVGRLCAAGMLTDGGPGSPSIAFRHALGRDAVLADMNAVERASRHAAAIGVLEVRWGGSGAEPTEELLNHALGAGDRERGFTYSMRAAHRAELIGAHAEAEAHVDRALDLWTKASGVAGRADALVMRGRLRSNRGEIAVAVAALEEARGIALGAGRTDLAALALALSADARWDLNRRGGVVGDLVTAVDEAAAADVTADVRAELAALLARGQLRSGEPQAAVATAREGLALGRPRQDPVRLSLRIILGAALVESGDVATGRADLLNVAHDAAAVGDHLLRLRALLALAAAPLDRPAERVAHAEAAVAVAAQHGLARDVGRAHLLCAAGHLAAGDWEDVEREADVAATLVSEATDPVAAVGIRVVRAARERRRGNVAEAMEQFQSVIDEARAGDLWEHELEARVGLARCHLAAGDVGAAGATLAPVLPRWRSGPRGPVSSVGRLLVTAVELACVRDDPGEAAALAGSVAALRPGPWATYAAALADAAAGRQPAPGVIAETAGAIERFGRRPEAARMYLIGAEALTRFPDVVGEAGDLVAHALALYRAMGSDALGTRAEGLLRRLDRSHRPATPAPGLTRREGEVLALIVEGLSNRGIAERLVISESTAARHVFNIFSKLGVHTRAQAVAAALGARADM